MNAITGNLLSLGYYGELDVIVHGCNCFCVMGKGIALSIKTAFPSAYAADRRTVVGDWDKLGTITSTSIGNDDHVLNIVNGYTQFHWSGNFNADYDAIRNVFKHVKETFGGTRIGYPLIGAGLAGGDWSIISKIIDEELVGENHILVEWDGSTFSKSQGL